jgi:hypothetical protein
MGQARKVPKKKRETKEDVLKKEINEVKALVESVEERVNEHFKHHEEGSEHTHSHLEGRIDELERRVVDMIHDMQSEIEKIHRESGGAIKEEEKPPAF